ncbi:pyroglutamyl-peptidase 1 isoform X1 [Megalopta genalis]|uniref:pyroglutamyl-peptidase 1 isoform X1 n=1 Tax=Megalopta genalis TaxID=115081 RepID=UPI0014437CE3|nr:pyroglutamyl-peptidase 1 isoform X1 [Megalopta genalis]
MSSDFKYTALVTGFGPFSGHDVNASWEAVKELKKLSDTSKELKNVKLIIKEIPVSYDDVSAYLSKLIEDYNPTVILNVGVSSLAKCLTLECCARSCGYVRPDIYNKCPDESTITSEIFKTNIDVHEVCKIINESSEETKCSACISDNAGQFLCEYIFYKSLQMKSLKVLFVHVPDLNVYSSAQTARGLYHILCCMIKGVGYLESNVTEEQENQYIKNSV